VGFVMVVDRMKRRVQNKKSRMRAKIRPKKGSKKVGLGPAR